MKELTENETKRVKTLFELGWQKREIARMLLGSRAEGEEVEMLEAIKEVIPVRHKDG
jgi:Holliday junction resolvasome RuvABC DNA-binding subunit